MKETTTLGVNRTGVGLSPIRTGKMLDHLQIPTAQGDSSSLANYRALYINNAQVIGAVPLPSSVKGVASSLRHKIKGHKSEVFLDKLGERLCVERTAVRMYDLLLNKCRERAPQWPEGLPELPIELLQQIRDEELLHFHLLLRAAKSVGADPTVLTPSADVSGVCLAGVVSVCADSRMTIAQTLQAVVLAELADNESWVGIIRLADELELTKIVDEFREALTAEERHLHEIRSLLSQITTGQSAPLH